MLSLQLAGKLKVCCQLANFHDSHFYPKLHLNLLDRERSPYHSLVIVVVFPEPSDAQIPELGAVHTFAYTLIYY